MTASVHEAAIDGGDDENVFEVHAPCGGAGHRSCPASRPPRPTQAPRAPRGGAARRANRRRGSLARALARRGAGWGDRCGRGLVAVFLAPRRRWLTRPGSRRRRHAAARCRGGVGTSFPLIGSQQPRRPPDSGSAYGGGSASGGARYAGTRRPERGRVGLGDRHSDTERRYPPASRRHWCRYRRRTPRQRPRLSRHRLLRRGRRSRLRRTPRPRLVRPAPHPRPQHSGTGGSDPPPFELTLG